MKVTQNKHWWMIFTTKPYFHWGMNEICPFIWAGWWLITFDPKLAITFLAD